MQCESMAGEVLAHDVTRGPAEDELGQGARADDEHQRRSRLAISSEAGGPPTDDRLRMRDITCSGDGLSANRGRSLRIRSDSVRPSRAARAFKDRCSSSETLRIRIIFMCVAC
jgi:hypothetical protein